MAETLYSIDILRLATATAHWPALTGPQGSAERRSPTCGSRVRVDVTLGEGGAVAAIGLVVSACALGQASAAIMAASAAGRTAAEFRDARTALAAYLGGEDGTLPDWPDIGRLVPARPYAARHASILLAFDAAVAAIDAAVAGHADSNIVNGDARARG
jgi:NifU-like protein involved in Fe-S cluster formation